MCNCYRYHPDGRHRPGCRNYTTAEVDIPLDPHGGIAYEPPPV
jgi:hypothetical protein